MSCATWL